MKVMKERKRRSSFRVGESGGGTKESEGRGRGGFGRTRTHSSRGQLRGCRSHPSPRSHRRMRFWGSGTDRRAGDQVEHEDQGISGMSARKTSHSISIKYI